MLSTRNGSELPPLTTETEQSRFLITDTNRETDASPENNKLLSLIGLVSSGEDLTIRKQELIDREEQDELIQTRRSFPKMLGEKMNCIQKLLLFHFAEYCFAVKKQVIDKHERLSEDDLPIQRKFEEVDQCIETAQKDIEKIKGQIQWHDFLIILMKGDLKPFIYLSVLGFTIDSISKNLITVIMQWLLEKVQEKDINSVYGMGTALIVTNLIGRLAYHHGYLKGEQFSSKARLLLINIIYNKLITLNAYSQKEAGIGNVLNILTSDLDTLEKNFYVIFQIFVLPINFIFAVVIMWLKFDGPIGLLPLGITFVLYPLQIYISNFLGKYLAKFKLESDKRLKITNELVDGIRLMKMYAWERAFKKVIKVIRTKECRYQFVYQLGFSLSRSITYSSQLWASCSFFIILYYSGYDNLLTIPAMISSIQLLNLFRSSCVSMFQYAITSYVFQKISFGRIAKLFNMNNIELQCLDDQPQDIKRLPFGIIKNFSAYWNKQEPVFQNFTVSLNPGQFWGLVGAVGSGKSTFLMSLLKEIPYYKGLISQTNTLKIAYVEQEPFIFPDSIRYNITFGRQFNKELYKKVIEVTRLIQDINTMENQDHTEIGEKGVTLSGGQRARIALARALYSCADVYLLDDPISAVDSKVAKYLYTRALNCFIYEYQTQELGQQPLVILATHQIQYALRCSHIAMIDKGQLAFQGTTQEFRRIMQHNNRSEKLIEDARRRMTILQMQLIEKPQKNIIQRKKTLLFNDNFEKLKIYYRYFKMWNFGLLFVVLLLNAGFVVIYQIYLRIVVTYNNHGSSYEQQDVIQQLGYLTLGGFIIAFLKYILTFIGCQKSSTQIHNDMFESLIKLPIQYFDATPSGRIINNFSIDQNLADIQTNAVISEVMEIIMGFIITLVTIGILQPYFLIIVFFLILGNYFIFNFFNQLIGQSKDVDLKLRGPQVDYVKKTLWGIMLIRTYNKAMWFKQQFIKQSNQVAMAILNLYYVSKLFQVSIEATGLIAQIIGVYLVIYLNGDNLIVFSQQILLLSSFNDQITWGLKQFITFETQLNTYNRMFKFIDEKQEEDHYKKQDEQLTGFPQLGTVEFKNVRMRYNDFSGLVLKGLTIQVAQGMKVGCVGRTGAGKSTILQALFRMIEIEDEPDSFIKISGIDIKTIGLQKLRSSIGIIPQTPFIITGTIRQNLDPFNEFKDDDILEVLEETRLKDVVDQLKDKLYEQMNEQLFSTGQKQLICLARLILRKKKIVVLDEATANLDMETDEFIQHLIKTKLKESTVITIAHRLNTIADYDRILVMDDGVAVEFDTPFDLLACDVDSLCIDRDTEFARLVQNTGKQNCEEIFNISKQAFLRTQFPSSKQMRSKHTLKRLKQFQAKGSQSTIVIKEEEEEDPFDYITFQDKTELQYPVDVLDLLDKQIRYLREIEKLPNQFYQQIMDIYNNIPPVSGINRYHTALLLFQYKYQSDDPIQLQHKILVKHIKKLKKRSYRAKILKEDLKGKEDFHYPEKRNHCNKCKVCNKKKSKYYCKVCYDLFKKQWCYCLKGCFAKFHSHIMDYI